MLRTITGDGVVSPRRGAAEQPCRQPPINYKHGGSTSPGLTINTTEKPATLCAPADTLATQRCGQDTSDAAAARQHRHAQDPPRPTQRRLITTNNPLIQLTQLP